ncbi:protein indeterminate-domain 16-like [Zingiber officinale]|uniref:protein indeterminate-domain 16-like n=1 Tax=Zingiber officinale TaxID=94328 RepID=UPI001C4B56BA|nr:protein indeterminate-domain 16-like [Zingiber officinale]
MLSPPLPALPPPPGGGATDLPSLNAAKKKRRPAGTPDPEAEVVSLSPRTLMESDRYVCEICKQGFQRDQNLQMHRRRHKVPWKLVRRPEGGGGGGGSSATGRKRVFVCPEPSCLHHDPRHALGDLVGIKKHFRRKHSGRREWACARCAKAYAVLSDFKAHLKICGTRGHSCDCGRVFSRVESFIEHQNMCAAGRAQAERRLPPAPVLISSATSSSDTSAAGGYGCIELLQLMPPSTSGFTRPKAPTSPAAPTEKTEECSKAIVLQLSLGPAPSAVKGGEAAEQEADQVEEARKQARRQLEVAEWELERARRIRQQAEAELGRARAARNCAVEQANATLLQVTCCACKQQCFMATAAAAAAEENSFMVSSSVVTEGEEEIQPPNNYKDNNGQLGDN